MKVKKPNVLLITVDDMNYNSTGIWGCKTENITPNIDFLASEGMRFKHSHVTIAICQPSRQVLMTGRYPHRNGAPGFDPIDESVPTIQEELKKAGYINGIIGKASHLAPRHKYCWDYYIDTFNHENDWGRNPELHYEYSMKFFDGAKESKSPFFLMANSHDPHRPFSGSKMELERWKHNIKASRRYKPEDVDVPGFLPDIPDVREELAEYYASVHRCDETTGAILKALKDSGFEENTLVMFLSDNGMAFPFAKTNCYLNSTRTPWIVRWPGMVTPGKVDNDNFISAIDFMPTILDAANLSQIDGMDGESFLHLLQGKKQATRDNVFTVFNKTVDNTEYPMRCIQNKNFGYIYNAWSDQEKLFKNGTKSGLTYKAMCDAAQTDEKIAQRVRLYDYRVKEEFYNFDKDPDAMYNLVDNIEYVEQINFMKKALLKVMEETNDPIFKTYKEDIKIPD